MSLRFEPNRASEVVSVSGVAPGASQAVPSCRDVDPFRSESPGDRFRVTGLGPSRCGIHGDWPQGTLGPGRPVSSPHGADSGSMTQRHRSPNVWTLSEHWNGAPELPIQNPRIVGFCSVEGTKTDGPD